MLCVPMYDRVLMLVVSFIMQVLNMDKVLRTLVVLKEQAAAGGIDLE